MAKFRKTLVPKIKEEIEENKKQEQLHKKHGVDEEILIIEKSNMGKFLIRTLLLIIRSAAWVLIAGLALIGLTALIYPDSRSVLQGIWNDTLVQIQTLTNR